MLLNVKYRPAADVKYCPLEKSNGQCDIYFQLKRTRKKPFAVRKVFSMKYAFGVRSFDCAPFVPPTSWPGADTRNLNRRGSTLWRPLVSVDLRTDEISSTGGHRFFAPFFTENCPLDTFPSVSNPRMTLYTEAECEISVCDRCEI